jgi:hypothetical protein
LVGPNSYTITFERAGYLKQEKTPLDFRASATAQGEFIAYDIQLEPVMASGSTPPVVPPMPLAPPTVPSQPPMTPPAEDIVTKIMGE